MSPSNSALPWSRILAEGVVIVVSILLAFAIDAWWDRSQDRAREQAYLRLLETDLTATLENNARFSANADATDRVNAQLVQAYYKPLVPPADSLRRWLAMVSQGGWVVQPRLGTAQSLVSSGDLALIRGDSLKLAIRDYLTNMNAFEGFEEQYLKSLLDAGAELGNHVNEGRIRLNLIDPEVRDSLASAVPLFAYPAGPIRPLPAVDFGAVVRDPEIHGILYRMLDTRQGMRFYRELQRDFSEELLEEVQAAIEG